MLTPTFEEAKALAAKDFPHKVFLRKIALQRRENGPDEATKDRLMEIRRWCIDQFGPSAMRGYTNPPEAYNRFGYLDPHIARCTYNVDAAWYARMYEYRFKDVRQAVLFKLYAY